MASPVSEIERPNDVPEKIGKYVIINKIGKGSTGTVFLSHDPYYRRDVAIKVLPDTLTGDPGRMERFHREAQLLAQLNHPNIASIYGYESRALALELVERLSRSC